MATVRGVERSLGISYGRANTLVSQLVQIGVLAPVDESAGQVNRHFYAPEALAVLLSERR